MLLVDSGPPEREVTCTSPRVMVASAELSACASLAIWGRNQGAYFGVDDVTTLWLFAALLGLALSLPVRWFGRLKARRRDLGWLKYFW